jgi:hypothetical protein
MNRIGCALGNSPETLDLSGVAGKKYLNGFA